MKTRKQKMSYKKKIAAIMFTLTLMIYMFKGHSDNNFIANQAKRFREHLEKYEEHTPQAKIAQIYFFITKYIPDWTYANPLKILKSMNSDIGKKDNPPDNESDKQGTQKTTSVNWFQKLNQQYKHYYLAKKIEEANQMKQHRDESKADYEERIRKFYEYWNAYYGNY
jgi:hypothetical protein